MSIKYFFISCILLIGLVPQSYGQRKSGELIGVPSDNRKPLQSPIPKKALKDVPILPKLFLVEGGTFIMGNENNPKAQQPRQVTVASFYMAETEVTNIQFCTFLNAHLDSVEKIKIWIDYGKGSSKIVKHANEFGVEGGYEQHPVTRVSWEGAEAYSLWISQLLNDWSEAKGMIIQPNFRLPTEAEWEYAAKAGDDKEVDLEKKAWYSETASEPNKVKTKKKNEFKIYDLYGNVAEWCLDVYREHPADFTETLNPYVGQPKITRKRSKTVIEYPPVSNRVCKGGSYQDGSAKVAAYERIERAQQKGFNEVGFRVVMTCIGRTYVEAY